MMDRSLASEIRSEPRTAVPPSTAIRELREIGRIAVGLVLLALVCGILSLRAVERERRSPGPVRGIVVAAVPPGERVLRVGDVVERVDGRVPASLAQVEREMASRHPAILLVRRGGREVALAER